MEVNQEMSMWIKKAKNQRKRIITKIPFKNFLFIKLALLILSWLFVGEYIIYLFHVGIFNYFQIPTSYIELSERNLFSTSLILLLLFLGYLSLIIPIATLIFSSYYYLFKGKLSKNILYVTGLIIGGCFSYKVSDGTLCNILEILIIIFTFLIGLIFFSYYKNNKQSPLLFFIYSIILGIYLLIPILQGIIIDFGYQYARNIQNFQTIIYKNETYAIFSYSNNFLVTKKIHGNNTIDKKTFLINQNWLNEKYVEIKEIKNLDSK